MAAISSGVKCSEAVGADRDQWGTKLGFILAAMGSAIAVFDGAAQVGIVERRVIVGVQQRREPVVDLGLAAGANLVV